ncbi:hypothetical protein CXB40_11940 [Pseudomonas syringae pv. avii]|uniref:Uncharacterized protein n=1 Tax=Pseudomonas syringae pv. tomato (strain ATCC BAA-871 / DC3000) TaxID=223283 RepID=Q888P3_PSESM|nr:hypothetical protein PSPTO_0974 [Pseudomonas syringae pv. tomato str. DC3000]MBW8023234.1 hypothetical protein [Pseudomonas syringae pv. tomato]MCF5225938.1 hypothetical protein [Pseudomonas syringae]POQ08063.1 hypothetical protein CXB40_11940 [Pseudomonas syringae pv. avii]PYD04293.1 hypothetical protein DND90_08075 [Pseudomonas syringae pv. maculicola]
MQEARGVVISNTSPARHALRMQAATFLRFQFQWLR